MSSESRDSDGNNNSLFDEDLEALRRACMLTGTNPDEVATLFGLASTSGAPSNAAATSGTASDAESDSVDDLDLARNIQERFLIPSEDVHHPIASKPVSFLLPTLSDEDEDDFEVLRAIQRRFSVYDDDALKSNVNNNIQKSENGNDSSKQGVDFAEASNFITNLESCGSEIPESHPSGLDANKFPTSPLKQSIFPKGGHLFVAALKKNRCCQRFIRSKLIELEARIEENKKLRERVKILKDFHVSCKRRMGRALSQKKDARVQLISVPKLRSPKNSKVNDKKVSAIYYGPAENPHVANYMMALKMFPLTFSQVRWSKAERENLAKGIKQQCQEILLQESMDIYSSSERSFEDPSDVDNIMGSKMNLEITPENIRLCLPKVNWQQLASMHVLNRSAADCEARWLNCEDPLINHNPWTVTEDKNLLVILQERGLSNWIDIAVSLGTNRTPFQCLARYQRSLNVCIMKREWTVDEDAQLRNAVEVFGEHDWQLVASALEGRTGTQCSNRWKKTLHPTRHRVGRWTSDEDKRLKVAVMLFGSKTWKKIAEFVPGRTQVQCRERWVNCLDPSLNCGQWTEEEDAILKAAITEHHYCWSKVAACVPPRTDSQCRRRWKVLFPHEVPLLQAARKIQKAALISNFVDRESERPALCPNDFIAVPEMDSVSEPRKVPQKQKRKSQYVQENNTASRNAPKKKRSQRPRKGAESSFKEVPETCIANEAETVGGSDASSKKRKRARDLHKRDNTVFPESLEPEITDVDGVGTSIGKNITSSRKKKPINRHSITTTCIEQSVELKDSNYGNIAMPKKKRAPKQSPERQMCAGQSEEHQASFCCPDATLGENDATLNTSKRTPKLHPRRRIYIEQSEEHQTSSACPVSITGGEAVDMSGWEGWSKDKFSPERSFGTTDVDPITPVCLLQEAADDMTLASFINSRLPEGSLEPIKNNDEDCSPSSKKASNMLAEQLTDENQVLPVVKN